MGDVGSCDINMEKRVTTEGWRLWEVGVEASECQSSHIGGTFPLRGILSICVSFIILSLLDLSALGTARIHSQFFLFWENRGAALLLNTSSSRIIVTNHAFCVFSCVPLTYHALGVYNWCFEAVGGPTLPWFSLRGATTLSASCEVMTSFAPDTLWCTTATLSETGPPKETVSSWAPFLREVLECFLEAYPACTHKQSWYYFYSCIHRDVVWAGRLSVSSLSFSSEWLNSWGTPPPVRLLFKGPLSWRYSFNAKQKPLPVTPNTNEEQQSQTKIATT